MLMSNAETGDSLNHIFQPHIDHKRFMEESSIVMKFIISAKKDLFQKPYIAMLTSDDVDYMWGCCISFNAGAIPGGNLKDNTKKDCGYIQFEPLPVPEIEDHRTDTLRRLQYSFFLKLAYHVCHKDPRRLSHVSTKPKWMDESVAAWFQTMKHFETLFRNEKVNFGYVLAHDTDKNDIEQGRFRTFDLPQGHPASSMPYSSKSDTAMASFTFLLKFCSLMKSNQKEVDLQKTVQVMLFDNVHVHSEEEWNSYFFDKLVNLYQIVDRIAHYQLGSDMVEFEE